MSFNLNLNGVLRTLLNHVPLNKGDSLPIPCRYISFEILEANDKEVFSHFLYIWVVGSIGRN